MSPRPRPSSLSRPPRVLPPGAGETLRVLDGEAPFEAGAGDGDETSALTPGAQREVLHAGAGAVGSWGQAHGYVNVNVSESRGRVLVVASPRAREERILLALAAMLATGPVSSTELTAAVQLPGARHGLQVDPRTPPSSDERPAA